MITEKKSRRCQLDMEGYQESVKIYIIFNILLAGCFLLMKAGLAGESKKPWKHIG
jgi:hypothetical protein